MELRRSLRLILVVAATVSILAALSGVFGQANADEGAPGGLVSAEPTTVQAAPLVAAPVRAWSLLYRSTTATGAPDVVSGTLLVPTTPWPGARPIVTYAVGTHGLGDQCAPSAKLRSGTEQELGLFAPALARGLAVVLTDYEGLGTPGDHTYTVARSEGHAVLDAVRAATAVPGAGLDPGAPVGIWGYSQGGGAAAKAAELAPTYAPELDVRGVAAGGVPADLGEVFAAGLDRPQLTGLITAATTGFDAAYPELDLRDLLTPAGRALYDDVKDDCVEEIVAKGLPTTARRLSAVPDPLGRADVRARLADNGVGAAAPPFPAFVYHAQLDELIPVAQGRELATDWRAGGADVTYRELPATEHVGGAVVGSPEALAWLAERLAG